MHSDVSFERRLRYQDMAIARLMCETRLLRDENAELVARLEGLGVSVRAAQEPQPAQNGDGRVRS